MKSVFFIRSADNMPYILVTVSEKGTDFQPLMGDADDMARVLSEAYDKVPVKRRQLDGALDDDLEIEGPFKVDAEMKKRIASFLEEANIPEYLPGTVPPKITGKTGSAYNVEIADIPLDLVDDDEDFRNLVEYKALAFIADQTKTTFNYEVKRIRAVWDPSLSIPGTDRRGGWRCPTGTRYGGQITDRFGRNCGWGVARRIANAVTNIGERLENIDDRRRGRRVGRRNERMAARLRRGEGAGRVERGLRGVAERLEGGDGTAETLTPNAPATQQERVPGRIERGLGRIAEILQPAGGGTGDRTPEAQPDAAEGGRIERMLRNFEMWGEAGALIADAIKRRRERRERGDQEFVPDAGVPAGRGGGRRRQPEPEAEQLTQDEIEQLRAAGIAPNEGETFDAFLDRQYQNYRDQIDAANAGGGMAPRRPLGREAWERRNRDELRNLFDEVNGNEPFNPPARPAGTDRPEPNVPFRPGAPINPPPGAPSNPRNRDRFVDADGQAWVFRESVGGNSFWERDSGTGGGGGGQRGPASRIVSNAPEPAARPRRRPGDLIQVEGDGGAIPLPQVNVGDEARPMPRVGEAEPDARVVRPSRRPRGPASRIIDGAAGERQRPDAEQVNDADIAQIIQDFADAGVPLDELDLPDRPQDELLKEMMMGRLNNLYRQLYGPDGRINNLGRRLREERAAQGGGLQPGANIPERAPRRPRGRLGGDRPRGEDGRQGPVDDVRGGETFDQYVDRKYAEYEAFVDDLRARGDNAGKMTRAEWLAVNRGNLRESFDQRQGRQAARGEAPEPAPRRVPRNPRNRRAEASDGIARDTATRRPTENDVPAGTAPAPARQVTAAEVAETPEAPRSAPDSRSFRNIRNRFGTDGMPDEAYWRAPDYDGSDKDELERRFGQYYSRRTNRINSRGRAARAQVQQGEGRPRGGGQARRRRAPAPQPEAAPAPARPSTPAAPAATGRQEAPNFYGIDPQAGEALVRAGEWRNFERGMNDISPIVRQRALDEYERENRDWVEERIARNDQAGLDRGLLQGEQRLQRQLRDQQRREDEMRPRAARVAAKAQRGEALDDGDREMIRFYGVAVANRQHLEQRLAILRQIREEQNARRDMNAPQAPGAAPTPTATTPRPATRPRRSRTPRPSTPSAQPAPNVVAPDVEVAQNRKDLIRDGGIDIDAKLEERRVMEERDLAGNMRALRARLNGGQEGEAELDERIRVQRERVESSRIQEDARRAEVEEIADRLVGANRSLTPQEKAVIRNYLFARGNSLAAQKKLDAYQQAKDEYVAAGRTAGIPTAGRQRRAEMRRAQEAQRIVNAPAPIPSNITTGQRERAEAVKGVLADGLAKPRADRFVQNHGHKNVGGIEVPEPVPVGNANIRTPADAAAHLLNNGSLDEVPDIYLRDAILANAAFPGESTTGKRFVFAPDPGDGINNRGQNVREDKTYVVRDTVTGKRYIMKTPSYVTHEAIGELIAGAYGQAMGRQMARIRVAGDVRPVLGVRGQKRNMPILIEHFGDIVDVDSIDSGNNPGGTPELEISRAQVSLLDAMMGNSDRHGGNFLWGNHGGVREMMPIDHGIFGSGQQVIPALVERSFKTKLRNIAAVTGGDSAVARMAALTPQQIDAIVAGTEAALIQAAKTQGDRTAIQRNMSILRTNLYNAKLWAEDVVANPRRRP